MTALAHNPISMNVAGLPFVRPDATTKLTPKAWDMLGQAILLKGAGLDAAANAVMLRLEDRLGVHAAHRRALVNGVESELLANRRKGVARSQTEHRRARDLSESAKPAPITQDVLSRMAEARYHETAAKTLRSTGAKQNRAAIKDHETKAALARKAAKEAQAKGADKHWSGLAVNESECLARARGEEVRQVETEIAEWVRDDDGCLVRDHSSQVGILRTERAKVCRVVSRDALEHMLELGHVTKRQYAAGLSYRESFTTRGDDMRPAAIGESRGGGGTSADVQAFERAKRAAFAKTCETAVAIRCTKHLSARQMLQWVAGMGRSMRDFGSGGRAYERNRLALSAALDVVIDLRPHTRD